MAQKLTGAATPSGTGAYADRFPDAALGFFRKGYDELCFSSIGLGTGGFCAWPTIQQAYQYEQAIVCAVAEGINVIDTATNGEVLSLLEKGLGCTLA